MEQMISSTEAMIALGAAIGAVCRGGEVIELVGDVGAGKTTFTKGLAKGLGVAEAIQSPTFTISRVYDTADDRRLVHYDFYRLEDAGVIGPELAESVADSHAVTVIEWGDIVTDVLPEDTLRLTISSPSETDRMIVMTTGGEKSRALMEGVS